MSIKTQEVTEMPAGSKGIAHNPDYWIEFANKYDEKVNNDN